MTPTTAKTAAPGTRAIPDLPFGITSFGAGHRRSTRLCLWRSNRAGSEYDMDGQSNHFLRLDLRSPQRWEEVGTVPRRAGLAIVAYEGKVYRVGGFEVRNKKDDPADMHSMTDFSRFDPATGRWEDLAPLPKGRSSHDAILVGSRLIVVGGWELRGSEPSIWHDSALQIGKWARLIRRGANCRSRRFDGGRWPWAS